MRIDFVGGNQVRHGWNPPGPTSRGCPRGLYQPTIPPTLSGRKPHDSLTFGIAQWLLLLGRESPPQLLSFPGIPPWVGCCWGTPGDLSGRCCSEGRSAAYTCIKIQDTSLVLDFVRSAGLGHAPPRSLGPACWSAAPRGVTPRHPPPSDACDTQK